jgi:hypothetical protein
MWDSLQTNTAELNYGFLCIVSSSKLNLIKAAAEIGS